MSATFDPATAAEAMFLPLADPDRRELDPIGALRAACCLRILLGLGEQAAVRHARQAGWTWSEIGESLGMSKQAAQQRFGLLVDLADAEELEPAEPRPVRRRRRPPVDQVVEEAVEKVTEPPPHRPRNRPGPRTGKRQQPKKSRRR
jgi:hypothetical protein